MELYGTVTLALLDNIITSCVCTLQTPGDRNAIKYTEKKIVAFFHEY